MSNKSKAIRSLSEGNWAIYLASFPPQHQLILRSLGKQTLRADAVAIAILQPSRSIQSCMAELCKGDVLKRIERGTYAIADPAFAEYLDSLTIDVNKEDFANEAESSVYKAIAPLLKSLEAQGAIVGDSHTLAQSLATKAKQIVLKNWRRS